MVQNFFLGFSLLLLFVGCKNDIVTNTKTEVDTSETAMPTASNPKVAPLLSLVEANDRAAKAMSDAAANYEATGGSTDPDIGGPVGAATAVIQAITNTGTTIDTTALAGALGNLPDATAVEAVNASKDAASSSDKNNKAQLISGSVFSVLFGGATAVLVYKAYEDYRKKLSSGASSVASSVPDSKEAERLSSTLDATLPLSSVSAIAPNYSELAPAAGGAGARAPMRAVSTPRSQKMTERMKQFYDANRFQVHVGFAAVTGALTVGMITMAATAGGSELVEGSGGDSSVEVDTTSPAYIASRVYTKSILCVMSARANTVLQVINPAKVNWDQTYQFCDVKKLGND